MCYFPTLYFILAVGLLTFGVSKALEINIKLDNTPNYRRQRSGENSFLNATESDSYHTNSHRPDSYDFEKRNLKKKDEFMSRTSDRSYSLEKEDVSEKDDSTKKMIKSTARTTHRKQKKRYTTASYTTRNTKFEIPTTIKKLKIERNDETHYHRQKNIGRHIKHRRSNKLDSMEHIKFRTYYDLNKNPNENDHPSFPTFRDIIMNVLKIIRLGGNDVKNNPSLRFQDIKRNAIKDNNMNSFEQKFRQRNSYKSQKEVDEKIDGFIYDFANATLRIIKPWIATDSDIDGVHSIKNKLKQFLNTFGNSKQRSSANGFKGLVRALSTIYEDKFNELIENTDFNKLKNMNRDEKKVLNTIYLGDRFISRLFNYLLDDENNEDGYKRLGTESSKETNMAITRACMKLGVCRTRNSFTAFVMDFFTILMSLDNNKFEETFDSLSKVIGYDNFVQIFGQDIDNGLKEFISKQQNENLVHKRSIVATIKSIFSNRHAPLILFGDDKIGEVNKTVAFIELINILDEKVSNNAENIQTWNRITRNFLDYEENQDVNIQRTVSDFVANMKHVVDELDETTKYQVLNDLKVLLT